jgi:gluconolactonase
MAQLSDIVETNPVALDGGFVFTEGPVWHPDGYYYFGDVRGDVLYRIRPGQKAERIRETAFGNGTTLDIEGRLIQCEGDARLLTRTEADGTVSVLIDSFEGKRLTRPNDVVCKSDGSLYFTDPTLKTEDRDFDPGVVFRIQPDGTASIFAFCESPNGIAFSPNEKILYVSNSRYSKYILAFDLDEDGNALGRRIFADLNHDRLRVPDGLKVDVEGHIYCACGGGLWVYKPNGQYLGLIPFPTSPSNLCFGDKDLRTLFVTAGSSVYTMRLKIPGVAHPWYAKAASGR